LEEEIACHMGKSSRKRDVVLVVAVEEGKWSNDHRVQSIVVTEREEPQ
jgi:hypothetical protein